MLASALPAASCSMSRLKGKHKYEGEREGREGREGGEGYLRRQP